MESFPTKSGTWEYQHMHYEEYFSELVFARHSLV